MIWFPGWADPTYQRFVWLIGGILAVLGLALGVLRCTPLRRAPGVQKTWIAYRPWVVMAPAIFLIVGLGRVPFILGLAVLSLLFVKEFAQATGLYRDWGFVGIVYAGVLGLYWTALTQWHGLFVAMPVYGIVVLLMIPIFRNAYAGMIQKIGLSAIALIYLGWFPAHLTFLMNRPEGYAYLLFLVWGTELNDAGAFLTGKLFGKHPLVPNISPGKTVEGTLGSLVTTALFVWSVRGWLPGFHPIHLVLSIIIVWIGGTVGDLVMSVVKRDLNIKDMGRLIPGHGGLLDRFDSLIFTAPLFFHMVNHYVQGLGGRP